MEILYALWALCILGPTLADEQPWETTCIDFPFQGTLNRTALVGQWHLRRIYALPGFETERDSPLCGTVVFGFQNDGTLTQNTNIVVNPGRKVQRYESYFNAADPINEPIPSTTVSTGVSKPRTEQYQRIFKIVYDSYLFMHLCDRNKDHRPGKDSLPISKQFVYIFTKEQTLEKMPLKDEEIGRIVDKKWHPYQMDPKVCETFNFTLGRRWL